MINKVTLIGRCGQDPEIRTLDGGVTVARVSVATDESYKDKDGEWQNATTWHNVVMWRELAERAEKSLKKGSTVYVEGKITYRKYNDKDGNERTVTDIVAASFRSLDKKESSGTTAAQKDADDIFGNTPATRQPQRATAAPQQTIGNLPDDLPF